MQRSAEKKRKRQQQKEQIRRQRQFHALAPPSDSGQDEQEQDTRMPHIARELEQHHLNGNMNMAHSAMSSVSSTTSSSSPSSIASFSPSAWIRVKAGNFSRLLYTNPVCLLTASKAASSAVSSSASASASASSVAAAVSAGVDEEDRASAAAAATTHKTATSSPSLPSTVSPSDMQQRNVVDGSSSSSGVIGVATAVTPTPPVTHPSTFNAFDALQSDESELLHEHRRARPAASAPVHPSSHPSPTVTVSTAPSSSRPSRNVMTISWLTATSNHGEFMCSMNASRYTASLVHSSGDVFVLSVPIRGMETMVKQIGACSGNETDKVERLSIPICRPGNKPMQPSEQQQQGSMQSDARSKANPNPKPKPKPKPSAAELEEQAADAEDATLDLFAIQGCAAHLVCEVKHVLPASASSPVVPHHNILFCKVRRAYVNRSYWLNGNNFITTSSSVPPYLTFLGSGNFAYVTSK